MLELRAECKRGVPCSSGGHNGQRASKPTSASQIGTDPLAPPGYVEKERAPPSPAETSPTASRA